ncbi:MAG: amidohydrolase family protein [Pirellulaceae bacterium]
MRKIWFTSDDTTSNPVRLSRRQFVRSATVAAALSRIDAVHAADEAPGNGFIDAHVHVWTPDVKAYPLDKAYDVRDMQPASFTPQQLMAHAKPAGVDRVVLIQMSFYGTDNSYMLDVIAEHPGVYSGVAIIDPAKQPRETMRQMKERGVRGFRIVAGQQDADKWLDNNTMKTMWKIAADEGMAICPLMNPEYLPALDAMCAQFPRTRVVIDHFARIGVTGTIVDAQVEDLCKLARHDNTYVKTSAFYALGKKAAPHDDLSSMIRRCVDAYGSNRLMWASDCPYQVQSPHRYQPSIDLIQTRLDFLSEEDRQWMLRKTAAQVFFT